MILAVVSGKGGTGKTTVAVSLARTWLAEGPIILADCDVDGPNAHHFLAGLSWLGEEPVSVPEPVIDPTLCGLCGACAEACQFNALMALPERMLLVPSLCQACGACLLACPTGAISERPRRVGVLRRGSAGRLSFLQGELDVGERSPVAVVRAVIDGALAAAGPNRDIILDGPPGASCPAAEVVRAADVCLLVTEPTPFGLHDLEQAFELIRLRGKPAAVILNRAGPGPWTGRVERWCAERDLELLLSVPERRAIAEAYAAGQPLVEAEPELRCALEGLRTRLRVAAC